MMRLFIIAGEPSGDLHAAHLAKDIKVLRPDAELYGIGGRMMCQAGIKLFEDITLRAVTGFFEVLHHLREFRRIFHLTLKKLDELSPDAIILVDYPGFNLRLAKAAKKKNLKVIYYISPQVWAWDKNRIHFIKRYVDKMLVFFDFEERIYKDIGMDVSFVGHPLIDIVKGNTETRLQPTHHPPDFVGPLQRPETRIALLPGSRYNEVKKHLPIMLKSAVLIYNKLPNAKFILFKYPNLALDSIVSSIPQCLTIIEDDIYEALSSSDLAIVSSGTATLESAILGVPMIIIYKTSFLSYLIGRCVVKIQDIGLVNIVAGKRIVPELIQYNAIPERIAKEALRILQDKERQGIIRKELAEVKLKLGFPGASSRAAYEVLKFLRQPLHNIGR